MSTEPAPGTEPDPPRTPLSRERVIAAAIDLADAEGLAALSMRRLATRVGVEAMSLYYHVRNKDDVLGGMLERALLELAFPPVGTPWKEALRMMALSAHAVLDRHRWAAALLMSPSVSSPTRVRWMETVLGALAAARLPAGLADHAYHALDSYVVGFTLWQSSIPFTSAQLGDMARDFLATMPVDELPHTVEHIQWHLQRTGGEGPQAFESGMDMFLDGLELARSGLGPSGATARVPGGPST